MLVDGNAGDGDGDGSFWLRLNMVENIVDLIVHVY